jgi:hypothetical protein
MRRQVIHPTFANDPDFAPITQAVAILDTGANDRPLPLVLCVPHPPGDLPNEP